MKILFVMEPRVNAGSIQAASSYVRAAAELDHEIAIYGRPNSDFRHLQWSTDVGAFDHIVFIIESRLEWMSGLRLPRILSRVPRRRRAILDADGMYNRVVTVNGYDRNHASEHDRRQWLAFYHELADKVLQPTLQPLEPDVIPLLFYGYDPGSRMNGEVANGKSFDIAHLGHNWWRWEEVGNRLLPAIERIRSLVGRICFLGLWWDAKPSWAAALGLERAFQLDAERFRRLHIEVRAPVPYVDVIPTMSRARVNIMTQRPLLRHLKLTTSKYFEVFSADTIPLVMLNPNDAEQVYGAAGRELALHGRIEDKLLDALHHPAKYKGIVDEVRSYLATHHSYRKRVEQLISALAD